MVGKFVASLALAILIATVYGQSLGFDFIGYDDPAYVTANPVVQKGLTADGVRWAFTTGHFSNWHPLTWMSLMVDSTIFGVKPVGFHSTNVLLHIGGTLLLFWTLMKLPFGMGGGFVAAAIYALHPLHVESVAAIAERKGILSTFFFMLCLWFYVDDLVNPSSIKRWLLWFSFAAGLMCKQMLVTLPALLILLDLWPLRRGVAMRQLFQEKLPLLGLAAIFSVVAYAAQSAGGALSDLESVPLEVRAKNAVISSATYLARAVWPTRLAPVYPLLVDELTANRVMVAVAFLAALVLVAVSFRRTNPQWAFGLAWYFIALAPVSGLVQIGSHARADRYTDIPLIGVWMAAVWSASRLFQRSAPAKQIAVAVAAITVSALAVCSWQQASHWRDTRTLFEHAVRVTDRNYIAMNNLGLVYRDQNQPREALAMFAGAVRIRPDSVPALINLGNHLAVLGDAESATVHLANASRLRPESATIHSSLGRAFFLTGKYREAEVACRMALSLDPQLPSAHGNLGTALMEQGKQAEGIKELETAVQLAPRDAGFEYNLAAAYYTVGRNDDAEAIVHSILQQQPRNPAALRLLEMIDAKRRGN